jgi:Response regulator containing CheY-like receiver and SARP domains
MLIFAIDDEPKLCRLLEKTIQEAAPQAEVRAFPDGLRAIEAIETQGLKPSVIFSDIIMPELDGLELAVRLKTAAPDARLVFVTGYTEYALKAFQLHASGYILKPPEPERVREELRLLERKPPSHSLPTAQDRLQVRCFGHFEVFWKGKPLAFGRQQTKELLAYLVDHCGGYCSAEEVIAGIWEDVQDLKAAKHRLRNLTADLRKTLADIGQEGLLLRRRNQLAIISEQLDCDYYRMLDGDMEAVNQFRGEYMAQYSWAELTKGNLYFKNIRE